MSPQIFTKDRANWGVGRKGGAGGSGGWAPWGAEHTQQKWDAWQGCEDHRLCSEKHGAELLWSEFLLPLSRNNATWS